MALNVEYIYKIIDKYSEPLNRIKKNTDKATLAMKKAGKTARQLGTRLKSIGKTATLFVTAPILGIGAAMVKAASDAEETRSKYATIFKDIGVQAESVADKLATGYGLSGTAARQLMGDTGDMLTGFGFAQKEALDLSVKVNELAADLASFTNFSGGAEGASKALTKALLGERESVKSLGIAILEEDVKKKVALMRSQGMRFATMRQAKAYATLQIAVEQSKNAIGDYERTKASFANTMRRVQARLQDFNEEFGRVLLPYALKLANAMEKLLTKFKNFDDSTKKIIVVVALLVAVIGPLLFMLGLMSIGFSAVIASTGTLFAILSGVGALAFGVWLSDMVFGIDSFRESFNNLIADIKKSTGVLDVLNKFAERLNIGVVSIFSEEKATKMAEKSLGGSVNQNLIDRIAKLKKDGKTAEEIRSIVAPMPSNSTKEIANNAARKSENNMNVNLGGKATIAVEGAGTLKDNNIGLNGGGNLAGAH